MKKRLKKKINRNEMYEALHLFFQQTDEFREVDGKMYFLIPQKTVIHWREILSDYNLIKSPAKKLSKHRMAKYKKAVKF